MLYNKTKCPNFKFKKGDNAEVLLILNLLTT